MAAGGISLAEKGRWGTSGCYVPLTLHSQVSQEDDESGIRVKRWRGVGRMGGGKRREDEEKGGKDTGSKGDKVFDEMASGRSYQPFRQLLQLQWERELPLLPVL